MTVSKTYGVELTYCDPETGGIIGSDYSLKWDEDRNLRDLMCHVGYLNRSGCLPGCRVKDAKVVVSVPGHPQDREEGWLVLPDQGC